MTGIRFCLTLLTLMGTLLVGSSGRGDDQPLKIGLIGLDSSHCVAFTKAINAKDAERGLQGARIVAAFPGGSPDIAASADRIEGYTKTLSDQGIQIVSSIDELLKLVDAVIINSVDGRIHISQAIPVLKAGKPLFIDKPITTSLKDAQTIFELSKSTGTPCFSSSSLRFCPDVTQFQNSQKIGDVLGCDAYSPCSREATHPDLFWYGIHGVETLCTVMGPGCESVSCTRTDDADLVVGVWKGGRVGTFRGTRTGKHGYGVTVFGTKAITATSIKVSYVPMLVQIVKFFQTGKPPVSPEQTLEVLAFMEAANESERQGGVPVLLKTQAKTTE